MIEIRGKYGEAKIFTDKIEDLALSQIYELLNHPASEGANIRIMPDVHAGKGCVIGYTAKLTNKVIPNLIGVDIGCGVSAIRLKEKVEDLKSFDEMVHNKIPTGKNNYASGNYEDSKDWHKYVYSFAKKHNLDEEFFKALKGICKRTGQDYDAVIYSLGSLGGGNHYMELGVGNDGDQWLSVHSGSRNFGLKVANYWQNIASNSSDDKRAKVEEIKRNFKGKEIEQKIKEIPKTSKDLAYLTGEDIIRYLADSKCAVFYAYLNRLIMLDRVAKGDSFFQSVHNYIDLKNGVIRKGAIEASKGQKVIIPINMRDGSIIGIGKGNPDYNYSAPHGAGRKMSRSEAKKELSLEKFSDTMQGVYSSCVGESTLDESPMAYKSMEDIIDNITDSVEIIDILKPIWNFKSI